MLCRRHHHERRRQRSVTRPQRSFTRRQRSCARRQRSTSRRACSRSRHRCRCPICRTIQVCIPVPTSPRLQVQWHRGAEAGGAAAAAAAAVAAPAVGPRACRRSIPPPPPQLSLRRQLSSRSTRAAPRFRPLARGQVTITRASSAATKLAATYSYRVATSAFAMSARRCSSRQRASVGKALCARCAARHAIRSCASLRETLPSTGSSSAVLWQAETRVRWGPRLATNQPTRDCA